MSVDLTTFIILGVLSCSCFCSSLVSSLTSTGAGFLFANSAFTSSSVRGINEDLLSSKELPNFDIFTFTVPVEFFKNTSLVVLPAFSNTSPVSDLKNLFACITSSEAFTLSISSVSCVLISESLLGFVFCSSCSVTSVT